MASLPQKISRQNIADAHRHKQQAKNEIEPFEHGKKLRGLEWGWLGIRQILKEIRIRKDGLEDQEMEAEKANSQYGQAGEDIVENHQEPKVFGVPVAKCGWCHGFCDSRAQVSFNVIVRLKMGLPGALSLSRAK